MALNVENLEKGIWTATGVTLRVNSEPLWMPSVDSLDRLGRVLGAFMSKCLSLWILLIIPVIINP